jgi:hypothetical protein
VLSSLSKQLMGQEQGQQEAAPAQTASRPLGSRFAGLETGLESGEGKSDCGEGKSDRVAAQTVPSAVSSVEAPQQELQGQQQQQEAISGPSPRPDKAKAGRFSQLLMGEDTARVPAGPTVAVAAKAAAPAAGVMVTATSGNQVTSEPAKEKNADGNAAPDSKHNAASLKPVSSSAAAAAAATSSSSSSSSATRPSRRSRFSSVLVENEETESTAARKASTIAAHSNGKGSSNGNSISLKGHQIESSDPVSHPLPVPETAVMSHAVLGADVQSHPAEQKVVQSHPVEQKLDSHPDEQKLDSHPVDGKGKTQSQPTAYSSSARSRFRLMMAEEGNQEEAVSRTPTKPSAAAASLPAAAQPSSSPSLSSAIAVSNGRAPTNPAPPPPPPAAAAAAGGGDSSQSQLQRLQEMTARS